MKKILFSLLILLPFMQFSCTEDPDDPFEQKIEQFKLQTAPQFIGNVMDYEVAWKFLGNSTENGINVSSISCQVVTGDPSLQERKFSIYEMTGTSYIRYVELISPEFSVDSSYAHKKSIFDIGIKQYKSAESPIGEGFEIAVNTENELLSTRFGSQNASSLEVIKLEEVAPYISDSGDYKRTKIWIIVSCTLYDNEGQEVGQIIDGLFLAEILIEFNA